MQTRWILRVFGWPHLRFPTKHSLLHTNGSRWPIGGSQLTSNERPFCYKIWKQSKLPITKLQKKSLQFWWLFSLWCFNQFGDLLSPIAHKVVGSLLLDSNSSMDGTNPPFKFPMWQLTNKETKRQAITKDQNNEMKVKLIEF